MHPKPTAEERSPRNELPVEPVAATQNGQSFPRGVSAMMLASQEAYWRDLPELLKQKSRERQWVAYHGQRLIGFAPTPPELYIECERLGIPRGEFYVDRVAPRALPPWAVEELWTSHFTPEDDPPAEAS